MHAAPAHRISASAPTYLVDHHVLDDVLEGALRRSADGKQKGGEYFNILRKEQKTWMHDEKKVVSYPQMLCP